MASQINPNDINGAYPVAGQDNNSQGFRDNFTNTKTNFQYAASEITNLQNQAILKSALPGTTLDNNMNGAIIANVQLQNNTFTATSSRSITGTGGNITVSAGGFQPVTVAGGGAILDFSGFPVGYGLSAVTVAFGMTAGQTLTFPSSVAAPTATLGIVGFAIAGGASQFTAPATATYTFTFSSSNGGLNVTLTENNAILRPFNPTAELIQASAATLSPAVTYSNMSIATTGPTASLGAGVNGQVKVINNLNTQTLTINVTSYGWTGAGTLTMTGQGSVTLISSLLGTWIPTATVGNVAFA